MLWVRPRLQTMSKLERRITVTAVVLPFLGFCLAVGLLWGGGVSALDLSIMAVMYILTAFGVTIGFHRLLTHRSFEAAPWLRATLAALGSMSVQGAVIHWVADHRKHHTFTDEAGDPHSPHTEGGAGWRGVARGIWHSHMGWLFDRGERAPPRDSPVTCARTRRSASSTGSSPSGRCSASCCPSWPVWRSRAGACERV